MNIVETKFLDKNQILCTMLKNNILFSSYGQERIKSINFL
jgi:hypothetical protein